METPVSTRTLAAVAAALIFGATVVTSPAQAVDSAAPGAQVGQERSPSPAAAIKTKTLSAAQLAKRDEFAKRSGVAAALLDGPWHIINAHSGKCLTISGAGTANTVNAVQYTCDYSSPYNEEWYFDGNHIWNGHSGKCLTVAGASTANNANAVQYTCDSGAPYNENWNLEDVYGSAIYWHIWNSHSGKCLTVAGVSTANNANAVQFTCDYTSPFNEEWRIAY